MKISDLIAYLQKYQQEFGDVDVELSLDGAKIGPDGSASKDDPTNEPKVKPEDNDLSKQFNSMFGGGSMTLNPVLKKPIKNNFPKLSDIFPDKKTFSWREAEEKLKDSPYINKDIDINILNKYFKYATLNHE